MTARIFLPLVTRDSAGLGFLLPPLPELRAFCFLVKGISTVELDFLFNWVDPEGFGRRAGKFFFEYDI